MGEQATEFESGPNDASADPNAQQLLMHTTTGDNAQREQSPEDTRSEADPIAARRREIGARLARRRLAFREAVWDAELRKHLQRIADRLDTLANVHADEAARKRIQSLCDFETNQLRLDSALALSAKLDKLVVKLGDEAIVCAMLENEFQRDDTAVIIWKKLYGSNLPPALEQFRAGGSVWPDALSGARNQLAGLIYTRSEDYALLRARQVMKGHTFLAMAPVLLVLTFGLAWAVVGVSSLGWAEVLLVGLAGALGAVLSGTFKLRDATSHINDLRALRYIVVVQSAVGAAFGLLLLLVLEAGVFTIGNGNPNDAWAQAALVGFVGGFSEPFSLKLVERVAGLAEPPATPSPSPSQPPT